jgi:hypothetical protein
MTTSEQHKAIATACGLNLCQLALADIWGHTTDGKTWENFPDYTSDLNAMHEAEKVLDWGKMGRFTTILDSMDTNSHGIHTTAAQRAEAFLKTIGKWEESK